MPRQSLKYAQELMEQLMEAMRDAVFPQYGETAPDVSARRVQDAACALTAAFAGAGGPVSPDQAARKLALAIPAIRELLEEDVQAIALNDPAATHLQEIVFCYPAVTALIHYRTAHVLQEAGVTVVPRMLSERAHSLTGIDIHPAARIGRSFAIDHGTGIVIGETAVIGHHVTLYQGVTLGARNFSYDPGGRPVNQPRHPVLEDGVTVYANASILGRVTIGKGSVIGGNVWLTHSVPEYSRVVQGKSQETFQDGAGI